MKNIDFLPSRYRQRKAARNTKLWRLAVVLMIGGCIVSAALVQLAYRYRVWRELDAIQPEYAAAQARKQQLTLLENELAIARTTALLNVYLEHPWPKTRILAAVIDPLPETITLSELHLTRERVASVALPRAAPLSTPSSAEKEAELAKLLPAQRDLLRLRNCLDNYQLVVHLQGITTDATSLHGYLADAAASPIVAKAELRSIEKLDRDSKQGMLQFTAQLVIRPGYGQPQGPKGPPTALAEVQSLAPKESLP